MAQIYIVNYGTRDTKVIPINNEEYAAKIAAGLRRIADMLVSQDVEFLTAGEFISGEPNNTWLHVSMVTEPAVMVEEPEDITDPITVDVQPRSQFNVHVMIKHVADEKELAGGLTAADGLELK